MRTLGDSALLVDVTDHREAQALARHLDADEVVPGAATVGVAGSPQQLVRVVDAVRAARAADAAEGAPVGTGSGAAEAGAASSTRAPVVHEIPVVFAGDDLGRLGLERRQLERERFELEVGWLGFMPGFAYLTGLPERLAGLTRRPSPRTRVPAGSFAVAGGLAGIYPSDSPGGWQILGRTTTPLFDPERAPYALLQPGDTVRLVPVAELPPMARPVRPRLEGGDIEVLAAAFAIVIDSGRRGVACLGVPRAGAMSAVALRAANLAIGNEPQAAALEVLGTLELRAGRDMLVVAASHGGGPDELGIAVDGTTRRAGEVTAVATGQRVRVTARRRAVLAVSGGLMTPQVLGSRSSDPVSGLYPGPLRPSDGLVVGPASSRARRRVELPDPGDPVTLRAIAGPDVISSHVLDSLAATSFLVSAESDRTGIRLEPRPGATRIEGAEVPSHFVVPGAVQLPPSGVPVVLGPDCGPVGGYAVAATVITADLWRLASLVPGDTVRFAWVGSDDAHAALDYLDDLALSSVSGWFPTHVA